MKTKQIFAYYCEYCDKRYLIKDSCIEHEKYCPENPDLMGNCQTCMVEEQCNASGRKFCGRG